MLRFIDCSGWCDQWVCEGEWGWVDDFKWQITFFEETWGESNNDPIKSNSKSHFSHSLELCCCHCYQTSSNEKNDSSWAWLGLFKQRIPSNTGVCNIAVKPCHESSIFRSNSIMESVKSFWTISCHSHLPSFLESLASLFRRSSSRIRMMSSSYSPAMRMVWEALMISASSLQCFAMLCIWPKQLVLVIWLRKTPKVDTAYYTVQWFSAWWSSCCQNFCLWFGTVEFIWKDSTSHSIKCFRSYSELPT